MKLTVCHLYPDLMDTYGDRGNIIAIQKRSQWRGIETEVISVSVGDKLPNNIDLFFFGGGQDQAQGIVGTDLKKKASALKKAVEDGAVVLSICGGYQLLQKYFKTKEGDKIEGVGIFNAYTEGSESRFMNNLLIELNPKLQVDSRDSNKLVGFENHSGKTYLEKSTEPLGTVISGNGSNGEDKTEGAIYKNAFGCYLHGSLLPKNPHFADYLITKALEKKYGKVKLKPLDDHLEYQAHHSAIKSLG